MPKAVMGKRASGVVLVLATLLAAGCRAGEGEACARTGDCQQDLSCYEKVCRTKYQIGQIQLKRREAEWRSAKGKIFGQVVELKKKMRALEKELAEAQTDEERERLEKALRELRKAGEVDPQQVPGDSDPLEPAAPVTP